MRSTIAELNDRFRQTGKGGHIYLTPGIAELPEAEQQAIFQKVRAFDAFSPDNDPHQERDFGAFDHEASRVFWKIDYYAPGLKAGSEDPSDPAQTVRVLTIMLASEY